jgi:hypothetical protein
VAVGVSLLVVALVAAAAVFFFCRRRNNGFKIAPSISKVSGFNDELTADNADRLI